MTDTRTKDLAEFFIILCVFVPKPDGHQYSSHCPGSQPCYFRRSFSQSVSLRDKLSTNEMRLVSRDERTRR